MNDSIAIRAATPADLPALVPMVREYWSFEAIEGFEPARLGQLLGELLATPARGQAWLASVNGQPAGYLLAVYVFSLEHQGMTAEIDEFFVLPGHRGLGIGGRLLTAAEAVFHSSGCTNVALQIARGNRAARDFYRRHGYRDREGFELIDKMLTGD